MKQLVSWVSALFAGVLVALAVASVAVVVLIFSTPDAGVRRESLWGAVFFESVPADNGSLSMGVGVADWLPLIVIALAVGLLIRATMVTHAALLRRKQQLKADQAAARVASGSGAGTQT